MIFDDLYLDGIAAVVPDFVTVADAAARGLCDEELATGTDWLSVAVAGDVSAPDMAARAGRDALAMSHHDAADIAVLMHASAGHQGPDIWSPAHYVQRHTVGGYGPALEVRQGCSGMVAALELAGCYLTAAPDRGAALVTAADNWAHPLMDRWRGTKWALFGDAASALVLSRRQGFARVVNVCASSLPDLEELNRGGEALFPPGATIGHRVRLRERVEAFQGDQAEMARLIGQAEAGLIRRTLDEAGLKPGDISRVTHQSAGRRSIVEHILEPFDGDLRLGMWEFGRRLGHTGASDQVCGLYQLLAGREVHPGDHVMLLGTGVGMAFACAIVQVLDELPATAAPIPLP
ncbi:ketoacyl-ACP synthase III family protein [Kitasatospora sp. NBC_01246]|uniref:ketoacyl-ACP synthase III family protein n=1 Tax=Kitasatospora sp. NBC_01246 TaxID=2903570 RepID=UPI002E3216F7|nr:ketoacyl-ACP synthase III family protein [Kitasatospora sp. NBC_01246]